MSYNETIARELQRCGLPEKSAIVYAALLESGGAYPSRIAELTCLNRSTVYKVLLDLSVKGFVTEMLKGKKLFYQPEPAKRLMSYAKDQKDSAEQSFERFKDLIPQIEERYSVTPNKPQIRFFKDKAGIMAIAEDHLAAGKPYEMLGFANTIGLERFMPALFWRDYIKEKERIGITTRGILPDDPSARTFNKRKYGTISKRIHPVLKFIPKDQFPFNGEIIIYSTDKVSFFNFDDAGGLVGIIIEDKAIHNMMVRIFELAWKGADK